MCIVYCFNEFPLKIFLNTFFIVRGILQNVYINIGIYTSVYKYEL